MVSIDNDLISALRNPKVLAWTDKSNKFAQFCNANKTKIIKKLKDSKNDNSLIESILAELGIAYEILRNNDNCFIEYDPYPKDQGGPDLKITIEPSKMQFNVEVKRIIEVDNDKESFFTDGIPEAKKFTSILEEKNHQWKKDMINVLAISTANARYDKEYFDSSMEYINKNYDALIKEEKLSNLDNLHAILFCSTWPDTGYNLRMKDNIPLDIKQVLENIKQPDGMD